MCRNFFPFINFWNPLYILLENIALGGALPGISQRWFLCFWNLWSIENGNSFRANYERDLWFFWTPLIYIYIHKAAFLQPCKYRHFHPQKSTKPLPHIIRHIGASEASTRIRGNLPPGNPSSFIKLFWITQFITIFPENLSMNNISLGRQGGEPNPNSY